MDGVDPASRATIDALHAEISKPSPDRHMIVAHVARLPSLDDVETVILNAWDDPATLRLIGYLHQIASG